MQKRLTNFLIVIFISLSFLQSLSADDLEKKGLFTNQFVDYGFEINRIEFEGNKSFSDEVLLSKIKTRPSNIGFLNNLLMMYYKQGKKNPYTPVTYLNALEKKIKSFGNELRLFDENLLEDDISSLETFYKKHGFHDSYISYSFKPDSSEKENVLTFNIEEGTRYKIGAVKYIGLQEVEGALQQKINNITGDYTGEYFNEDILSQEIDQVATTLENNGFYNLKKLKPVTEIYPETKTDTIIIEFETGTQKRIGEITFKDIRNDQALVTNGTKQKQLTFNTGELYSKQDEVQSRINLLSLGVFESINITYTPRDGTDSILDVKIVSVYSNQREWEIGPFVNRTVFDETVNAGIDAEIRHKNLGGATQKVGLVGKIFIRDISRAISDPDSLLEIEYQLGLKFEQPNIMSFGRTRVNASANPIYARRTINRLFTLESFTVPLTFQFRFPYYTYLNNLFVDLNFEHEKPIGFDNIFQEDQLSRRALESLILYSSLNDYEKFVTLASIGFRVISDKRNNPFNPTSGSYFNLSTELSPSSFSDGLSDVTLAKFNKVQFKYYQYFGINPNVTVPFKFNIGYIFYDDSQQNYVPPDRQLFAGGASSIRGWASRRLRYNPVSRDSIGNNQVYNFLENFVGSLGLFEFSTEIRYKFQRPEYFSQFWADQIASLGLAGFIDIGNSYGWLINEDEPEISLLDLPRTFAVSLGGGVRYDTPVGPFRIDIAWPVYDPNGNKEPFTDVQLHIGLGHAF